MRSKTTRRSLAALGAAGIVGGTGLIGIGAMTAGHASAATELVYTCNTAVGAKDVTVVIDSNAPATATVGDTIAVTSVTGKILLDGSLGNAMAGFLGWRSVSGVTPNTVTVTTPAGTSTSDLTLTTANTPIHDGSTWVNDGTYGGFAPDGNLVLPLASSPNQSIPATVAGSYTIAAPDTFTSTFTGTKADGSTASLDTPCTYKSGSKIVDTITVSEAATTTSEPTTTTSEPTTTTSEPTTTTSEPTSTTSDPTSTTSEPTSTTSDPTSTTSDPTSTTSEPTSTTGESTSTTGPVTPSTVQTDGGSSEGGANLWTVAGIGAGALGLVAIAGASLSGRRED